MHPDSVEEEGRARSEAKLHRSTNILGRLWKNRVTDIYISDQKAVSDSLFLIFANLVYTSASHLSDEQVCIINYLWHDDISPKYQPLLRATPVLVPLIHISLTASVYTTLAVAVERTATFAPSIDKDGPSTLKWENRFLSIALGYPNVSGKTFTIISHCVSHRLQLFTLLWINCCQGKCKWVNKK